MLQAFSQKRLASRIDKQFKLPEDVLDERGIYLTRTDDHSNIRFQILKDVFGDLPDTRTHMLSRNPVEVSRVRSDPDVVPFQQVTVTDWH